MSRKRRSDLEVAIDEQAKQQNFDDQIDHLEDTAAPLFVLNGEKPYEPREGSKSPRYVCWTLLAKHLSQNGASTIAELESIIATVPGHDCKFIKKHIARGHLVGAPRHRIYQAG